jgi:hypothetical protein
MPKYYLGTSNDNLKKIKNQDFTGFIITKSRKEAIIEMRKSMNPIKSLGLFVEFKTKKDYGDQVLDLKEFKYYKFYYSNKIVNVIQIGEALGKKGKELQEFIDYNTKKKWETLKFLSAIKKN